MARYNVSSEAICPFYKGENRSIIYCEGVQDNSSIQLAFPGSARKYRNDYCCESAGWKRCLIAQTLWRKYDKEGIPK